MKKEQILSHIKNIILEQDPKAEIILYGSFARGDDRPDSDIDILVLVEKENITWEDEERFANHLYYLELKTNSVISPLIRSKKIWHEKYPNTGLFINIKKEGIRL